MKKNFGKSGRDFGPSNHKKFGNHDRGGRYSAPKEMHKAVCADCGKECEVPFKPTEGRPVYCKDCYSKHKPQRF